MRGSIRSIASWRINKKKAGLGVHTVVPNTKTRCLRTHEDVTFLAIFRPISNVKLKYFAFYPQLNSVFRVASGWFDL